MTVFLSPLAGAGAQFFDGAGNPLAGGRIFTYTAGTTTPEATYTSISGGTAHSNPIVLNSEGRVPAEIWLSEAVSYKFVLQNAAGVQIGTYDDISGVNDLTVSGISWSNVTGTPTTLSGYGITDALSPATAASSMRRPPLAWTVSMAAPRAAQLAAARSTVAGMSCSLRSRKTRGPMSATSVTRRGPCAAKASRPILSQPAYGATA